MTFLNSNTMTKEKSDYCKLPQLLHNLTTHIHKKHSGNFFIVTDDNASCRFALSEGQLTHCAFKRHKGYAALSAMLTAGIKGKSRFVPSQSPLRKNQETINHDHAMAILNMNSLNPADLLNNEHTQCIISDDAPLSQHEYGSQIA